MNILKDKVVISKLKDKINQNINDLEMVSIEPKDTKKYTNPLDFLSLEDNWVFAIHCLVEKALVKYDKIDILKKNFLIAEINCKKQKIVINLNNSKCIYKNNDVEISIEIPIEKKRKKKGVVYYKLCADVDIYIKNNTSLRDWRFTSNMN